MANILSLLGYFLDTRLYVLFVFLVFLPTVAWSFQIAETKEGSVLVRELVQPREIDGVKQQPQRDPFNWPPGMVDQRKVRQWETGESKFAGLQLSGIFWDKKLPLAVIDGLLVQEGDSVKGVLVRSIFWDEVLLEWENQNHTLRFKDLFELEKPEVSSE